jgi:hypothetical protein
MAIADDLDWRLLVYDKGGCPAIDLTNLTIRAGTVTDGCLDWSAKVIREVSDDTSIDVVLTSAIMAAYQVQLAQVDDRQGSVASLASRASTAYREWLASGKRVLVIRDTPQPGFDIPECLARAGGNVGACSFTFDASGLQDRVTERAVDLVSSPNLAYLDPTNWFCRANSCSPVVGSVVAYVDDDHMTSTYSRSLAPELRATFREAGWLP